MKCRICGGEFEQIKGRGRPRDYCPSKSCRDVAKYISLLRSSVASVESVDLNKSLRSELFILANTL